MHHWWERRSTQWYILVGFLLLVAVTIVSMGGIMWSLHNHLSPIEFESKTQEQLDPGPRLSLSQQNPRTTITSKSNHHQQGNNNRTFINRQYSQPNPNHNNLVIRVLILIASVPRNPETICGTVQAILDNFGESRTATNSTWVEPPIVLVHRYGTWPCPPTIPIVEDPPSGGDNDAHNRRGTTTIVVQEFPPHVRISNAEQIQDYLDLMKGGIKLISSLQEHSMSNATHAMFLDDDVELCPNFSDILRLIHQNVPNLTMAHLGRGGSGVLIASSDLIHLHDSIRKNRKTARKMTLDDIRQGVKRKPKNIDKSLLEWALQVQQDCTVRPTTIQMRHVGLESRLHPGETWEDVDRCGQSSNNFAWQSLSERQFHPALFSEYCVFPRRCSPFSSIQNKTDDCECVSGYAGNDCGIPVVSNNVSIRYERRMLNAPIVVLVSPNRTMTVEAELEQQVLADARAHQMVNLYIIGYHSRRQWLADNVYTSPSDALFALQNELKNSSRFGELAFPIELVTLDRLLPAQELWTLKYYEVVSNEA